MKTAYRRYQQRPLFEKDDRFKQQEQKMNYEERMIWERIKLSKGKKNAVSYKTLAADFDINPRVVRNIVKNLIEKYKLPICSSYDSHRGGYYIPSSKEEIESTYNLLRSHGISLLVRAATLKKISLQEMLRQLQQELVFDTEVLKTPTASTSSLPHI